MLEEIRMFQNFQCARPMSFRNRTKNIKHRSKLMNSSKYVCDYQKTISKFEFNWKKTVLLKVKGTFLSCFLSSKDCTHLNLLIVVIF